MFSRAIRIATQFTAPYVGLRRQACGELYSTIGAFVMVNAEGWALTSAHIVEEILRVTAEVQAAGASAVEPVDGATPCVAHSEIWALPSFEQVRTSVAEAVVRPLADLAAIRFEPFDSSWIARYPVFRDPVASPVEQGMSVCRFGYPFHNIQGAWDDARSEFSLPAGSFPVPSFALDGVVARFHRIAQDDGSGEAIFVETSTPGLRGQSGGPLLDVDGRVCGIQSKTIHLDLGFDAQFANGEQLVTERQFLNVGAATHVSEILSLLDEAGASYEVG
jgi:hypothetical protein